MNALRKTMFVFLGVSCLWLMVVGNVPAASLDWPQFRGPLGNGLSPQANPPMLWSETTNVVWKVPLPGRGRSSPILQGKCIWLTAAIEQGVVRTRIGSDDMQKATHVTLLALCLDRETGKTLWQTQLYDVPNPDPVHWLNSWSTPTPTVEAGRLYCDFGTFGTACLNAQNGQVLWKQQLRCDHQVGPGSSPVLWHDSLVLVRDGRDAQYVTALDKNTGKTLWKTERPPIVANSANVKKSFSTPLVIEADGQEQMVVPGPHWLVSYNPASGKELWRVRHGNNFSIGSRPVFGHGMIYYSTGCMKAQLWAVRVNGQGDVSDTHVVWKALRVVPVMSSPILVGEEIYWVSDDSMATCADAKTGQVHWQERFGGSFLASPIATAGRLYFFRQDAKTFVVKPGKHLERLAENLLTGNLVGTPAVDERSFYLRTDTHLYCIRN
jgi:outer membrane protein assembly factor BamB